MNSITKKNFPRKAVFISLSVIILALLGSAVYIYALNGSIFGWTPVNESSEIDMNPASKDQINAGENTKKNTVNNGDQQSQKTNSGSDQPPNPAPQTDGKSIVGIEISSTHQTSDTLQIRTIIYSVQNTGVCILTITKSGAATKTITVNIQPLPSSSTCQGFDIPLSQLSAGKWHASLQFDNDSITGNTTKEITIK